MLVGVLGLNLLSPHVDAASAAKTQAAAISISQAEQAALAAIPGTVLTSKLEDEDGTQVYSVIVQAADGSGQWDVEVGTADGKVIMQELDNEGADASDDDNVQSENEGENED